jgi:small-conductance mechanosensitive channel
MIFQIFNSDFEALVYIVLLSAVILGINRFISSILDKSSKLTKKQKIIGSFSLQLISAAVLIYFFLEGFPFMKDITEQYPAEVAIFTGSLSTALAFASSGIFSNLISGMVLFSLKPFEIGDIIKIDGEVGVVRSIKLSTTVIETFDNIMVEKANGDVISTNILNYTIDLSKIKTFVEFKKELHYTDDLIDPIRKRELKNTEGIKLKKVFKSIFKKHKHKKIHNYIFQMDFPYKGFHKLINQVEEICNKYTQFFGFKPRYHITEVKRNIVVMFRIITFDAMQIFDNQPKFAKEIYQILFENYLKN